MSALRAIFSKLLWMILVDEIAAGGDGGHSAAEIEKLWRMESLRA
jgi:hypothetical protein